MTERLLGKRTIVTGAGSGIGKAAARLFAAEGAHVLCADIDGDSAQATAGGIGDRAVAMRVDVTEPDDCAAMVERAVAAFGGLDTVYANAGIAGSGRAGDLDIEDWNRVIAVNLTGVWLSLKFAIPRLIEASAVRNPLGRLGTTGDIANLALYLASDESSWVSGTAITIDGGMSAA